MEDVGGSNPSAATKRYSVKGQIDRGNRTESWAPDLNFSGCQTCEDPPLMASVSNGRFTGPVAQLVRALDS